MAMGLTCSPILPHWQLTWRQTSVAASLSGHGGWGVVGTAALGESLGSVFSRARHARVNVSQVRAV